MLVQLDLHASLSGFGTNSSSKHHTVAEIANCADIQYISKAFDWKRLKAFDRKRSIESVWSKALDWKRSIESVRLIAFEWKRLIKSDRLKIWKPSIESIPLKAIDWRCSIESDWLKVFDWECSIECVWSKAFDQKRSIESIWSKAFVEKIFSLLQEAMKKKRLIQQKGQEKSVPKKLAGLTWQSFGLFFRHLVHVVRDFGQARTNPGQD